MPRGLLPTAITRLRIGPIMAGDLTTPIMAWDTGGGGDTTGLRDTSGYTEVVTIEVGTADADAVGGNPGG